MRPFAADCASQAQRASKLGLRQAATIAELRGIDMDASEHDPWRRRCGPHGQQYGLRSIARSEALSPTVRVSLPAFLFPYRLAAA
jgi:hypothetical protein